jgi:uncharacterized protein (TIGR02186 family)
MVRAILPFVFAALVALPTRAQQGDVQIGLADDAIVISSNFSGTDVVVFGSIEGVDRDVVRVGDYELVVVLAGPREEVTVREKQRRAGVWVNGSGIRFANVPSSYSIASSAPLETIAAPDVLEPLRVGFENIDVQLTSFGQNVEQGRAARSRESLLRIKERQGLYRAREEGVEFLNPTLFRARLDVSANVPIGQHRARAFLFRDHEFIAARTVLLEVRKSGLEQAIYDLAHRQGLLYGFLAVLMAMATGWLASVIFRKD